MIIGSPAEGERMVSFSAEIRCNDCGKRVPGGLRTGEAHYRTQEFREELDRFMRGYLCGICRDRRRVGRGQGAA